MKPRVTADRLREVLHYEPSTGVFTWKVALGPAAKPGSMAGTISKRGRRHIAIDGTVFVAHRLAWLYVHGEWPNGQLDHRNLDKLDDRIENLRVTDAQGNSANKRVFRNNRLGVKGVGMPYRPRKTSTRIRYRARIRVNDKLIHLGYFSTPELANAAYEVAARKHFGEFARSA